MEGIEECRSDGGDSSGSGYCMRHIVLVAWVLKGSFKEDIVKRITLLDDDDIILHSNPLIR